MRRKEIIGIVVLAFGIIYASFWGLAQRDVNNTKRAHNFSSMTEEQFVEQYPFLKMACSFFHFDPYAPLEDDHQIPRSFFVFNGIIRHIWLGVAWALLGGAVLTFRRPRWFNQVAHYGCVAGFGGALFVAAILHPIVQFWNGK